MEDKNCNCECHHKEGMECCVEHMKSKEHLTAKKAMLEKKLAWVNDELAKAK